ADHEGTAEDLVIGLGDDVYAFFDPLPEVVVDLLGPAGQGQAEFAGAWAGEGEAFLDTTPHGELDAVAEVERDESRALEYGLHLEQVAVEAGGGSRVADVHDEHVRCGHGVFSSCRRCGRDEIRCHT